MAIIESHQIQPGDQGVVMCECSVTGGDAAARVLVDFGTKGRHNMLAATELAVLPLAAGLRTGDVVIPTVDRNGVAPGTKGVVVAGIPDDGHERATQLFEGARVTVDFGLEGRWDYLAVTELDLVRLAGGYRVGDRVASKLQNIEGYAGESGVVVGACSAKFDNADEMVLVEFESTGRSNYMTIELEPVRLAGEFRVSEKIVTKEAHNNIQAGTTGVVMGGCNSDAAEKLKVDFGELGVAEMHASQLEAIPMAGGFRIGDVVCSNIDHKKIKEGDEGVVVGPCNSDFHTENAHSRLLVDFGTNGKANYLSHEVQKQTAPRTPWTCSACTFHNHPNAAKCEICETERNG